MTSEPRLVPILEPLKISCTNTDCENDLHCFRRSKRDKKAQTPAGACQSCGEQSIDWARIHQRDISDIDHTVSSLKREWIRNHFWEEPLTERAVNYALRKGTIKLRQAVRTRLVQAVGSSSSELYRDGTQTPTKNVVNPIHAAQHAMGVCCRKCMEYWHAVPSDRSLTEQELDYFEQLLNHFLHVRVPDLSDQSRRVPPIRKRR